MTSPCVLSLLGLALLGQVPGEVAGWIMPPKVPGIACAGWVRLKPCARYAWPPRLVRLSWYLAASWPPVLLRSLVLWGLWVRSEGWGPAWLPLVPWGLWFWQGVGCRLAGAEQAGTVVLGGVGAVAGPAAAASGLSGAGVEPAAVGHTGPELSRAGLPRLCAERCDG